MEILPLLVYLERSPPFIWRDTFRVASMDQKYRSGSSATSKKASQGRTAHAMAWKVDGNHVYPTNDLREHSFTNCWCRPIDDDGVMVHNSLDGREQYERGERHVS